MGARLAGAAWAQLAGSAEVARLGGPRRAVAALVDLAVPVVVQPAVAEFLVAEERIVRARTGATALRLPGAAAAPRFGQ